MSRVGRQQGFTLIELLLAMTFLSLLLLAIAMTVIQISHIYSSGMIAKEVNQLSRTLSSEWQREIAASPGLALTRSQRHYLPDAWGGRLCLGTYSYVWNYAQAITEASSSRNQYTNNEGEIRLVKIPDPGRHYCSGASDYLRINPAVATELIARGDHELSLYKLQAVSAPSAYDSASRQRLYTVNFVLGTRDTAAVDLANLACKAPGVPGADSNYCAIQHFTVVLKAGSGV